MEFTQLGSIEVIAGPMFSGKSEELIRRVRRAEIAHLRTAVFKHAADTRYSIDHVVSHSEWRIRSGVVHTAAGLRDCVGSDLQVLGVDEAQFFDDGLVPLAQEFASSHIRIIIAGLDLDYLGKPFGPMPQLLAVAEHVTKLDAVCMQCGRPAHFSQRLVPASASILIGGHHLYEARCRRCFVPSPPRSGKGQGEVSNSGSQGTAGVPPAPFGVPPKIPTPN